MFAAQFSADQHHRGTPDQVRIFHNNHFRGGGIFGYCADHSVTEVFAYTTARSACTTDNDLLSMIFDLLNIGDDESMVGVPDPRAVDYRRCGNRSLSVGDVVSLGNHFYACASTGWDELEDAPRIEQRRSFGTTPLYEAGAVPSEATAVPSEHETPRATASVLRAVIAGWRRRSGLDRLWRLVSRRSPSRQSGVELFFLADSPAPLHGVAADLRLRGYTVTARPTDTDFDDKWSLTTVTTAADITEQTRHLLATIAARNNATFDGTGSWT